MVERLHAIDDELVHCMSQLQSVLPGCEYDEYFDIILNADHRGLRHGQVRPDAFVRKRPAVPETSQPDPTPEVPDIVEISGTTNNRTIKIHDKNTPLDFKNDNDNIDLNVRELNNSEKFKKWCNALKLNSTHTLNKITINDIVLFPGRGVGFVTLNAGIIDNVTNNPIPGIVLIRGHSVGMIIVLECDTGRGVKKYTVLTKQARPATGNMDFIEIPAGMMDSGNNFTGVAAKEIEEETGIKIQKNELKDLTAAHGSPGLYLSPGACDEAMKFYLFSAKIQYSDIQKLQGQVTGKESEGEKITLKIVELDQLTNITPDIKTICAYHMYNSLTPDAKRQLTCKASDKFVKVNQSIERKQRNAEKQH